MKCAIYVRVSTDKQELQNQIYDLERYAKKSDYEVFNVYTDIITGKNESRKGFDRLFSDAHKRFFDVLLFWNIDRFARSGTLFTLQKLQELNNLGIEWESYQEQYLRTAGPFKEVVISIVSTLAKLEREKISERTKAGMRIKKLQGVHVGRPKGSKDTKPRNRSCWKKS